MKFKPPVKSYDHQRKAVQWLWLKTKEDDLDTAGTKGGGLFFDPGTGKTKAGYDFISALHLHRGVRRILVLCPINAIQVWDIQADLHIHPSITFTIAIPNGRIADKRTQIGEIAPGDSELFVVILNYAAVIKRDKRWLIMDALQEYNPDVVILDESHHIKNPTAKQSKAAHLICRRARYVLLLTGTPIGKNYLDIFSQMKAIDPDIWGAKWTRTGKMSWTEFKGNYAIWGGRTGYELRGYINLEDLEARYRPHIRTARKEDILDMPQVTDQVIPVELSRRARRVYDIFAAEGIVVHRRHMIEAPIPLTKLLRLQQMTGGWVHDDQGEVIEVQRDKISILADLLSDLRSAGLSVCVFARFLKELEEIANLGSSFAWSGSIQGSVSEVNRRKAIAEFQRGGPNLMAIQIGAAEAIDGLQNSCSYGVFYSTDYSLIHWNQARGRLDRVGQKKPVTFYHLQVRSSVDSLILEALKGKKDIERMVMDDPSVLLRLR